MLSAPRVGARSVGDAVMTECGSWEYDTEPAADTAEEAARYWASVHPYLFKKPWVSRVAKTVAEYEPSSVVEFGASAGRNLAAIRKILPAAQLIGLDINHGAIEAGRERWGLDLRPGGVAALSGLKADLAFTVSVIDHLPEPSAAISALVDVAPTVLLIEPWTGEEGILTKRTHAETGETKAVTPFTYSWDYWRLAQELGLLVNSEPFPIETDLGPHYRLFSLTKPG